MVEIDYNPRDEKADGKLTLVGEVTIFFLSK